MTKGKTFRGFWSRVGRKAIACATATGMLLSSFAFVPINSMLVAKAAALFTVTMDELTNGTVTAKYMEGETEADIPTEGVPAGTEVKLTVEPDDGYKLKSISATYGDDNEVELIQGAGGTIRYTFTMPAYNVTVSATFEEIPTYGVTISAVEHGTVTATYDVDETETTIPEAGVPANTEVKLTVEPADGYQLVDNTLKATYLDGEVERELMLRPANGEQNSVDQNKWMFTMPSANVTVSATFEAIPTYSVTVNPVQNGTVTAKYMNGGTEAAVPETGVPANTEVKLTVEPDDGYKLKSISATYGDNNEVGLTQGAGGTIRYTFTMPASNVVVQATFKEIPTYSITIGNLQNGTLTATYKDGDNDKAVVSGVTKLPEDTEVTLTVEPNLGYKLKSVTLDAGVLLEPADITNFFNNSEYTFAMPGSNISLNAQFEEIPTYKVTIGDVANGTVTAKFFNGEYDIPEDGLPAGIAVTLTVTPNQGYQLQENTLKATYLDGQDTKELTLRPANEEANSVDQNKWMFTMPSADVTVSATFEAIPTYSVTVNPVQNGTVTATYMDGTTEKTIDTTTKLAKDTEVILKVIPDEDAAGLESIEVIGNDGEIVDLTPGAGGTIYTFKMPASNVTVTAKIAVYYDVKLLWVGAGDITANDDDEETIDDGYKIRKAVSSETVTITVKPAKGCKLGGLVVFDSDFNMFGITKIDDNNYSFVMPDDNVGVGAWFDGWCPKGDNWYYYQDGELLLGWANDIPGWEGTWFYFDPESGAMQTGWVNDVAGWEGTWFYFNPNSGAMQTGWLLDDSNGKWYYMSPLSGAMVTNWNYIDGTWYYMYPCGAMKTGWLLDDSNGKWYYMDNSGAMQTSWVSDGVNWYYMASDGHMLANTWTPDGYWVNESGAWIG